MFVAFSKVFTPENLLYFAKGAVVSLLLAAVSLLFGIVFGILGSSAKRSKYKIFRIIGNVYVEVIRGTPMLLQILILFSVIPSIYTAFTGNVLRINVFLIGAIAMSINSGAYSTELIRSGINGVDKGQWEACETLGLSHKQTMRLVILPQAFKRIIPPMISEFITLIKDSSLIFTIGAVELLATASVIGANTFNYLVPLTATGAIYLVMTLCISAIARYVEGRLAVSD